MSLGKRIFGFCLLVFLLGQSASLAGAQGPSATPASTPQETPSADKR